MTIILYMIRHYTKEAGVRNLEREIASICRKVAKEVVRKGTETRIELSEDIIQEYLGIPKFRYGRAEEKDEIGLAMGLAWTEFGGEILGIETLIMPGKGQDHHHRQAGRCHAGIREGGAQLRAFARQADGHRCTISTTPWISTCTFRKGLSPRTGHRPGSPWPPPSFRH